jgi:hypothetical protein
MIFNLFHLCIKPFGFEEQENRKTIDSACVFVNEETTSSKPLDQVADESSHGLFDITTSDDEEDVWVPDIASSDEECYVQPLERTLFTNDYENERKQMMTLDDNLASVSIERREGQNNVAGVPYEENVNFDLHVVEEPKVAIDDSTTIVQGEDEIGTIEAPELKDDVIVVTTKEQHSMLIEAPDHVIDENAAPTMGKQLLLSKDVVVNKNMMPANDDPERKVIVTDDSAIVITKEKVFVAKRSTTPGEKTHIVEIKRTPTKKRKSKRSSKKSCSSSSRGSRRLDERAPFNSPNKILLLESHHKTLVGCMQH